MHCSKCDMSFTLGALDRVHSNPRLIVCDTCLVLCVFLKCLLYCVHVTGPSILKNIFTTHQMQILQAGRDDVFTATIRELPSESRKNRSCMFINKHLVGTLKILLCPQALCLICCLKSRVCWETEKKHSLCCVS